MEGTNRNILNEQQIMMKRWMKTKIDERVKKKMGWKEIRIQCLNAFIGPPMFISCIIIIFSLSAVSLCLSSSFVLIERPLSRLCLIGCCCCCSLFNAVFFVLYALWYSYVQYILRPPLLHMAPWNVNCRYWTIQQSNRRKSNRKPHVLCLPYFMLTSCFSFVSFDFCASFRLIITYLFGNERPQKDIWNWINTGVGEQSQKGRPIIWYI